LADRTWAKIDKRGPDDCWEWTASRNPQGYGKIGEGPAAGRTLYAHRVVWELTHGAIPSGYVIDHLCRNTSCCNPSHLEPVPPRVNSLRGDIPNVFLHLAGICKNGHELADDNIYVVHDSKRGLLRRCLRCHIAREKSRPARRSGQHVD